MVVNFKICVFDWLIIAITTPTYRQLLQNRLQYIKASSLERSKIVTDAQRYELFDFLDQLHSPFLVRNNSFLTRYLAVGVAV